MKPEFPELHAEIEAAAALSLARQQMDMSEFTPATQALLSYMYQIGFAEGIWWLCKKMKEESC